MDKPFLAKPIASRLMRARGLTVVDGRLEYSDGEAVTLADANALLDECDALRRTHRMSLFTRLIQQTLDTDEERQIIMRRTTSGSGISLTGKRFGPNSCARGAVVDKDALLDPVTGYDAFEAALRRVKQGLDAP